MDYIASISYGKDSLAMLEVISKHGLPLTRIIHAEIWATDTIPAEVPEMIKFKQKADKIIYEKYGLKVEHIRASKSYEEYFYYVCNGKKSRNKGKIYGFPLQKGNWCNSRLKVSVLNKVQKDAVVYIGIAVDEPKRFYALTEKKRSPLKEYGWTEEMCRKWCEDNDLLSPIYITAQRGGCWFCHNQGIDQLRYLRKNYPEYWELLKKWDKDSTVTFKANGITIHDFDKRFEMEEKGQLPQNKKFRWEMIKEQN